jgi:SAM-dependent methyltransferase
MLESLLPHLCCAICRGPLHCQAFRRRVPGEIEQGVAWCPGCGAWFPIEDGLLELLPPGLAYVQDRQRFWEAHGTPLRQLGLQPFAVTDPSAVEAQRIQQQHFDWYAANDRQTYSSYEQMPFWRAVDAAVFAEWRRQVRPGGWLLDVGCAQGRSTIHFMDLPLHIVGFDVSKALVRQALDQYRRQGYAARATFFVGDGARLPFVPQSFDYVLIYGVLHHLPDPAATCRQVAEVLRPGGLYFGSENNRTVFRRLFDLLMKLNPLWHEEAGAQPLIAAGDLRRWFAGTPVQTTSGTRVFVPPHLVNLLGGRWGRRLLRLTDLLGRWTPFVRNHGGLIMIQGRHTGSAAATPVPRASLFRCA